jgi:hypothetical protein
MHRIHDVIVSRGAYSSADTYDLINSNITVVNLLRDERFPDELIAPDALHSYWVDYYRAQMRNGGFSQFVYNSKWSVDVVNHVGAGLRAMNVPSHLAYWDIQFWAHNKCKRF